VDYEFKAMHTVLAAATASDLLASSLPVSKFLDFHRLLVAFLDPQHVILAEHDNRLVGFVFSAPDINERAWGRAPKRPAVEAASWEGVDRELFDTLRALRLEIAHSRRVPPYVVFHDTPLRELARLQPVTLDAIRCGHAAITSRLRRSEKNVQRTARRVAEVLDDVRVDHGGLDVGVPEVVLNLADVHAVQQQMRREAVSQRVDRDRLVNPRVERRGLDGLLDD
jgi:hypothetical protein